MLDAGYGDKIESEWRNETNNRVVCLYITVHVNICKLIILGLAPRDLSPLSPLSHISTFHHRIQQLPEFLPTHLPSFFNGYVHVACDLRIRACAGGF